MQGCFGDIFPAMCDIVFPVHVPYFRYLYTLILLYGLAILPDRLPAFHCHKLAYLFE